MLKMTCAPHPRHPWISPTRTSLRISSNTAAYFLNQSSWCLLSTPEKASAALQLIEHYLSIQLMPLLATLLKLFMLLVAGKLFTENIHSISHGEFAHNKSPHSCIHDSTYYWTVMCSGHQYPELCIEQLVITIKVTLSTYVLV